MWDSELDDLDFDDPSLKEVKDALELIYTLFMDPFEAHRGKSAHSHR